MNPKLGSDEIRSSIVHLSNLRGDMRMDLNRYTGGDRLQFVLIEQILGFQREKKN